MGPHDKTPEIELIFQWFVHSQKRASIGRTLAKTPLVTNKTVEDFNTN